jgi:hypothetical protein
MGPISAVAPVINGARMTVAAAWRIWVVSTNHEQKLWSSQLNATLEHIKLASFAHDWN